MFSCMAKVKLLGTICLIPINQYYSANISSHLEIGMVAFQPTVVCIWLVVIELS